MARRFFLLGTFAIAGIGLACELAACDGADLTTSPDCRGAGCTCEQDPSQARCRGFSPEEGGTFEGGTLSDGSIEVDGEAGTDAGVDAPSDASDASDAEDQ